MPDHPRSCGANQFAFDAVLVTSGSSPLVRGQLTVFRVMEAIRRIIPARAGPTRPPPRRSCPLPDHPRSCGANLRGLRWIVRVGGSSPLVRGQPLPYSQSPFALRIIPARAGPTTLMLDAATQWTDHPRSCGANATDTEFWLCLCGSSPLVRGQRIVPAALAWPLRIIPARAGPTEFPRRPCSRAPDHPRSCGANCSR